MYFWTEKKHVFSKDRCFWTSSVGAKVKATDVDKPAVRLKKNENKTNTETEMLSRRTDRETDMGRC